MTGNVPGDARVEGRKHRRNFSVCKVVVGLPKYHLIRLAHRRLPSKSWADSMYGPAAGRKRFSPIWRQQSCINLTTITSGIGTVGPQRFGVCPLCAPKPEVQNYRDLRNLKSVRTSSFPAPGFAVVRQHL